MGAAGATDDRTECGTTLCTLTTLVADNGAEQGTPCAAGHGADVLVDRGDALDQLRSCVLLPVTVDVVSKPAVQRAELALLDLQEGDEQTLDIGPDLAFGHADENSVHSIKRSEFAADCELHPGLILEFSMPNGESLPGTILEFDDQMVKVDFNHPLAGQTVRFTVKIIKVENPPSAEIH